MLRLLIISIMLAAVKTEYSVDDFLGDWLPIVTYPKSEGAGSYCHWYNFKIAESLKCQCGDKETPVMKIASDDGRLKGNQIAVIVIGETDDAESKLKKCSCNGIYKYPIVLKKINANYFMVYSAQSHDDQVHYFKTVFVKKVPMLLELQAVLNSVPDLHGKEPMYLCPPSYFAS